MLTILFDGIAYGMLLFLLASGLAVTLGLMNFVNLAHGAFAMAGGYLTAWLSNRMGVPFLVCLPLAFLFSALLGALLEPTLYRRLYRRPHLDQVLFSIGLVFMAVAAVDYGFGSTQQFVRIPDALRQRFDVAGVGIGAYRLFIIVVCGVLALALQMVLSRTRFGSRLRAAVDDPRVASGMGIGVNRIFLVTFAFGSGLAGLGGALGAEILGLDPTFPLKFMIYFLIVVAVGGTTTITGPLLASLLLGIADVAGKYYLPKLGGFIIYTVMIAVLMLRPQGLFARAGGVTQASPAVHAGDAIPAAASVHRERSRDFFLWSVALLAWFVLPKQAPMLNEMAILALFAVSLDLILGYAGIVSLGHAAFFGTGAYVAALFAKHGLPDPLLGLAIAALACGLLGAFTSVLVLRGSDLTRLMVTLGVALILYELANRFDQLTGGADGLQGVVMGPLFGRFPFDMGGRVAYLYSLTVLAILFFVARRVVRSPFGYGLRAIRDNPRRAGAIGIGVNVRLAAVYTLAASYAGVAGALLAQTAGFVSLDVYDFHRSADVLLILVIGGVGWLYGGVVGAVLFTWMHDVLSALTPQYWQFWIGLLLLVLVLVGRERISRVARRWLPGRAPKPRAEIGP